MSKENPNELKIINKNERLKYQKLLYTYKQQIADLEAKLEEKEKQLENAQNLKAIEVADELSLKLSKIHNQDKISFALEQLEKVKENIHYLLSFDYNLVCRVNEQFDNQINVLRNNKDGIH